jgi:glycosyltransferase involved in cell wall biosynthesis
MANEAASGITQPRLSGGDRIAIECIKKWAEQGNLINVFTGKSGLLMYKRYIAKGVNFILTSNFTLGKRSLISSLLFEILSLSNAIRVVLTIPKVPDNAVIYSASDFWPDSIPAWMMKKRFKNLKWIATFFLFAPNPFKPESPYKGIRRLNGFLYYISQLPVYNIVKNYADMIWVTNEYDRWRFIDEKKFTPDKVIAVRGGVDTKTPSLIPEPKKKKYDAVFIGRFHPQKGVLELIDIWRYVCEKKRDAKLAMIGVGELEDEVKEKIRKYGLENNVTLFGFKDGIEKLKIFKESKVVVHPAIYDSGGMAPCEAMACGLPGVSFDLLALRTYYPKGMLKTPCFDLRGFAENILKLLNDQELYRKLQKEALELAKEWDWDKRAEELLTIIIGLMKNE